MSAARSAPLAIHLSARRLARARTVAHFVRTHTSSRRIDAGLVAAFRFKNDERSFARRLVRLKPNLWVFRSNQHRFCGDFLVVDMSSPDPARRAVFVVDLKRGAPLKIGGGGAGIQFKNAPLAVRDVAERTGIVTPDAGFELLCGDKQYVIGYLCALCRPEGVPAGSPPVGIG